MADFASVAVDLRSAFDTAFAASDATVKRLHDNDPPLDPQPNPRNGEEWMRFTVLHGQAALPEIGSDTSESLGRVVVAIFVGLGRGSARSLALASKVRDLYQGKRIGSARCYESECVLVGAGPENLWFQVNVSTRFRFESVPA